MIKEYVRSHGRILAFEFTGKVEATDYPELNRIVDDAVAKYGRIRVLIQFYQFSGWTPSAFWRDFRFSRDHSDTIERLAVVGENAWQESLVEVGKVLVKAQVKYFPEAETEAAWAWLESE